VQKELHRIGLHPLAPPLLRLLPVQPGGEVGAGYTF
jgi:hypothetical protein